MPWTVGAFNEDRATAVTTLTALSGVDDDHLKVVGDDLYVPSDLPNLIGIVVAHGTGTAKGKPVDSRITSPSLRELFTPWIDNLSDTLDGYHKHTENVASTYTQNADTEYEYAQRYAVNLFSDNPLPLEATEALNVELTNDAVTGARGIALVMFADKAIAPIKGDIRTIKAVTSFTPTANKWESGAITLQEDLPVGRYGVVGAKVVGGNTYGFFRFIFTGYTWRPGGVIVKDVRQEVDKLFRKGGLGIWGTFKHDEPPRLEVMELISIANPIVYLDIIKMT